MAFCTKCGRPLADGEICDCQKQQAAPNEQGGFNPYSNPQPEKTIQADSENVVINIDKDKMKQNLNNAVDKLQTGVGKGVNMVNETRTKLESSDAFEHGLKIVPDCISANDGEIPIKQYDFAKLRTRFMLEKSYGRLQITNKRVIFRAAGRSPLGKNIFHQEFSIDQLAGVEVRCKHEFNLFNFFLGLIFSVASEAVVLLQTISLTARRQYPSYLLFWCLLRAEYMSFIAIKTLKQTNYTPSGSCCCLRQQAE